MRIVVLGAGLIGVSSAWFLAEDGHEVIVVDRQPGPARETSFANGGQISTSHAEPWANPGAPLKALKWMGREDSPLLWRLRADPAQWAWGLRFLMECCPQRTRANIQAILALALDSRIRVKALRHELGLEYACLERGILHYYTDPAEFEHAIPQAALMREFGCERVVKTAAECLAIEPALTNSRAPIVGGTFTAGDESGDAQRFCSELAERAVQRGVVFRYDTPLTGLTSDGMVVRGVHLASGEVLTADAVVVALGSYTPRYLAPLGIAVPVYPAKGYSISIPLDDAVSAPTVSLTDDGAKIVISRLGQRLRVAGTAEFAGYDTRIAPQRIAPLLRRVREVFPQLDFDENTIEPWTGLRPATPGNVPLIGRTRLKNLYLNTGHGTLGWTMAAGSGRLLADLLSGRPPAFDPSPYQP
ncbi:MAG: D-amino acid dehydrogenase [Rhodocyclaceae bacterium]|nr:D-amino acid dehydrogenase [Rhodocyclaceae bacterium]MDZ4213454.1 D-amino acid dehydrogenase [Rhodocyclaceae bacterium]